MPLNYHFIQLIPCHVAVKSDAAAVQLIVSRESNCFTVPRPVGELEEGDCNSCLLNMAAPKVSRGLNKLIESNRNKMFDHLHQVTEIWK